MTKNHEFWLKYDQNWSKTDQNERILAETVPKPSKMKPKPTQNRSKIDAETGLQKKSEKVTLRIPARWVDLAPKIFQNP